MPAGQMRSFEELHGVHCGKEGKLTAAQWAGLCYGRFCGHRCPNRERSSGWEVGRRAVVREGCVGVHHSGSSGLADKVGEQDKLETSMRRFAKLK